MAGVVFTSVVVAGLGALGGTEGAGMMSAVLKMGKYLSTHS